MSEAQVVATPEVVTPSSGAAGFNKVRGTPPTESTPTIDTQEAVPAEAVTPAAVEQVEEVVIPPKEEPIAGLGLTPSEVKAQLASIGELRSTLEATVRDTERKLQGKMGSLKSEFQELVKSAQAAAPATVATVKREKLKRIEAEFGAEMADALAEDLSELVSGSAVTVDAEQINAIVQSRLDEAEAARAARETQRSVERIFKTYPDLKTITASDDFKIFKSLQPIEVQEAIRTTNDYDFVTETLNGFNAWKKHNDPTITKQKNTARLEGGLSPQGIPNNTPSVLPDKAGGANGFNKVRGKPK